MYFFPCQVLDRLAYNRLPVPMDHPEHTCRIRSSGCQATEHAQGPHLRNQRRLTEGSTIERSRSRYLF